MELLYHCNFGPPFLEPGSQLLAPDHEVAPRDARAVQDIGHFNSYLGPTAGYVEQVYWHDLWADEKTHQTMAALRNSTGDRAAVLRFDQRQLPYFSQWKNTGALEDGYVTGLEPGTNFPNPRQFERQQGRVTKIPPGKSFQCVLTAEICANRDQVLAVEQQIKLLARSSPKVHATPQPRWSKL